MITPDQEPDRIADLAASALRGGADVLQLRQKLLARGELMLLARRLRELTRAAGALLIVNDHLDLALLSEADGVHLGPDDLSVAGARRVAGDRLLIGASASTAPDALAAIKAGADYIGCGPAFATPLKPQKQVIGPGGVAQVAAPSSPSAASTRPTSRSSKRQACGACAWSGRWAPLPTPRRRRATSVRCSRNDEARRRR